MEIFVMNDEQTVRELRHVVSELADVEKRLRRGDTGNLTYRYLFSALASARQLLRDLEPQDSDGPDRKASGH
jgi:hypothetical protein